VLSLTCALVAIAVGGFLFASTRRLGIAALALLVLLHPLLLLAFLAIVLAVIWFIHLR
jgi:hypothetical protein